MKFLAAVVQMSSNEDVAENLDTAERLVREAAGRGARLVVLPEVFTCYGARAAQVAAAEPVPGPTTTRMAALAGELAITLVAGSILEAAGRSGKCHNTSCTFSPSGEMVGRYRKIHVFDLDLPGGPTYRESDLFEPGGEPLVVETEFGPMGVAICFDLRFPELFRTMRERGATILCTPSAFTEATGRAHWEVLVRCRGIETQSYVLAANRWGSSAASVASFGHAMIVDPWGVVIAQCSDGVGVSVAEIDTAYVEAVRARLPVEGP